MSYCRYGTDRGKSDVYIWGETTGINICLSWSKAEELNIPQDYLCEDKQEALWRIQILKRHDIHIPKSAVKRLRRELFIEKHHKKFFVKKWLDYKDWRMKRILSRL